MDNDMNMDMDMDVDMVTVIDTWNRLVNISRPRHLPKISVIGKKSKSIFDVILYGEAVLFPVTRPFKKKLLYSYETVPLKSYSLVVHKYINDYEHALH